MGYTAYLTIGHNVQGMPVHDMGSVCEYVHHYIDIDAYTAIPCYGMWRGDTEKSTRIEICNLNREALQAIENAIPVLAQALAQESIMFEVRASETTFIAAATIAAQAI